MFIRAISGSYRTIYTDGRSHPQNPRPTFFGHSVGHWEGDTLVIDTVGMNERFWMNREGLPHTEQLHLVERITPHRYLLVECEPGATERLAAFTHDHAEVVDSRDDVVRIRFRRRQVSAAALISELSARFPVRDVSVQEADIEDVIRTVYGRGKA